MPPFVDWTGKKFGRLFVDKRVENKGKYICWRCICDCGEIVVVKAILLTTKNTLSCGCYSSDLITAKNYKHGHSERNKVTKEYKTWLGMLRRCFNKNSKSYPNYGGRGIIVCDRWKTSYANFIEDMGYAPSPEHSIDRIDVDGNYEPTNCQWATATDQSRNRRTPVNNKSGYRGVHWHKKHNKWNARIGDGKGKMRSLGLYETYEQAVAARKTAEVTYWNIV